MNNYPLPLLIFLILFFVLILASVIIVGKLTYYQNVKENFNFRNHFPYELYYQKPSKSLNYFRILLFIFYAFIFVVVGLFAFSFFRDEVNMWFTMFVSLSFVISLVFSMVVFLLKPNYLSSFNLYSSFILAFDFLSCFLLGFFFISSIFDGVAYKVLGGFAFFFAAVSLFLVFNPRIKFWAKLSKKENDDGTVSYVRPKVSPLALTLWLSYACYLCCIILMIISLILNTINV